MITKFERKVIAGLTAFLMCLSMVFAVPVSVNAEAEQTQNEAVSDAKQEDVSSGVQVQDETVNDAQQDVTTGDEVDEEGDKTAGDIQKLPEMNAASTDAMLNTASQENVVGSITLKKDGTEESGSVMLQEDQTSVRYQLNVEEDGQYYITATSDNYWNLQVSLMEETEDGTQYVEIINSRVELRKAGTYYLELSDHSSEPQRTISWRAGKVKDMKPGEFDVELKGDDSSAYYRLTVDETGIYYVRSVNGMSVEIRDTQTGNEFSTSSFYKLKKENVYEVTLERYSMEDVSGKWSIVKGIEKEVKCDKVYINERDGVYYKFVPKTTGYYSTEGSFYDEEWNQIYSEEMIAGNTYYLVVNWDGYWSIQQEERGQGETVNVKVGEKYTTDMNRISEIRYLFTPEKTERYRFKANESVYIEVMGPNIHGFVGVNTGKVDFSIILDADYTYSIVLAKRDAEQVTWGVEKTGTKTVKEDTEYITTTEEMIIYDFVPSKSDEYVVAAKGSGIVCIYDDEGRKVDGTEYSDETEFGMLTFLENGKTYHISVIAFEKDARWKLESGKSDGDYKYRVLNDNTVEILKYSGEESNVVIPNQISNKTVTSIGAEAFASNEQITAVTIPAQVTSLQHRAFAFCSNLESVTFAQKSQLKKIGSEGFYFCEKLKEIHIPDSVTQLENSAFYFCASLNKVTIGKGLEGIENGVFNYCSNVKQIEIPDNIRYISERAFSGTGLTSVKIPDSVETIEKEAFSYCAFLEHVTIGNELAYIAEQAFKGCVLTEITWGDKVQKIGEKAFALNEKLTVVSIPNTVTEIAYGAFENCANLREIEIPDSVEAIGRYAFEGGSLGENGKNTAWYDAQADGDVYAGKVYYKYKGEIAEGGTVKLKDGTKGIAGSAFIDQRNLTGIEIPDSVTNIGDYAFVGCEKLNKVTVPASVTKIGEKALGYLTSGEVSKVYKLEGFTIRGVAGSAAEKYAKENEFNFEAYTPEYIRGDVDADRKVGIGDVRMTLRSICKKAELNGTQKLAADVEKDGVVDIKDLRKILRYVCGKIEYL